MSLTGIVSDPESQKRLQENIRAQVASASEAAINEGIEKEKEDIRRGVVKNDDGTEKKDAGFFEQLWATIKGWIFQIAEAFGFDKWLANMVGSPIPEQTEVKAVSEQVAESVSKALTDPDFQFKNKQEFEAGLAQRIMDGMDRSSTPSFSPSQLNKITYEAAAASANSLGLFDASGKARASSLILSPADQAAVTQFTTTIDGKLKPEERAMLATLTGKKEIKTEDLEMIGRVVAPKLAAFDQAGLKSNPEQAFITVGNTLRKAMVDALPRINLGAQMNLSNDGAVALADKITEQFLTETVGIAPTDVPKGFAVGAEKAKQDAISMTAFRTISTTVADEIKTGAAVALLAKHNNDWLVRNLAGFASADAETMKKYYPSTTGDGKKAADIVRNNKPDLNGELAAAEERMYKYVLGQNRVLDENQRKFVGDIVGLTVVGTIRAPENKDLDQRQLAAKLEQNIRLSLNKNKETIGKINPDKLVETIDKNNKSDILAEIAKGFADAVKTNKDAAYTQLDTARKELMASQAKVVGIQNGGPISMVGLTTDARDYSNPELQAGSRKTRSTGPSIT